MRAPGCGEIDDIIELASVCGFHSRTVRSTGLGEKPVTDYENTEMKQYCIPVRGAADCGTALARELSNAAF